MQLFLLMLLLLIIIIAAVLFRRHEKNNGNRIKVTHNEIDMNELFLSNEKGKDITRLVRVYSQSDLAIIRSLLQAYGINNYVYYENMGNFYPNLAVQGYTDLIIIIYKSDIKNAVRIIKEYVLNLEKRKKEKLRSALRNVGEFILIGYIIPTGRNKTYPELLV